MKVNLSIKRLEEQIRFLQSKLNLLLIHFTIETKSIADPPQSPNPFFPVIQDTPLATQYPDKMSNLQTGLHELRSNGSGRDEIIHFRAVFINQAESKVS